MNPHSILARITISAILLTFIPGATLAQSRRFNHRDGASLRAGFIAAFGEHFELVKSEFRSRSQYHGGATYWLAYAKPKKAGHFALQYRFKYNDKLYSHVEHEIFFGVGERGCRRGPPSSGVYARFCLGDTIIIPVLVEKFTEHEFKLVKAIMPVAGEDTRTFAEKYPETLDQGLDKASVENPSESLRYVGRRAHKMLHRRLGYTLELVAEFEAVKPGKFNLLVSSATHTYPSGVAPAGSIPIIVVARDAPVTLIAGREEVRGFSMGHNGKEYASSTSGNSYMTDLIVLQPGDRISVKYLSVVRGRQDERDGYSSRLPDPAESMKPVISVHPFALNTSFEFSGWIADYLPQTSQ